MKPKTPNLNKIDRSTFHGFMRYWRERKWLFQQTFGLKFTLAAAKRTFQEEIAPGKIFDDARAILREMDGESGALYGP